MTGAAFLELCAKLLRSYAVNAWPFAIMHGIVLVFLARSISVLLRETRSLQRWSPGQPAEDGAAILASFVRDSESLGGRGFVVPITDYSDRLAAEVGNVVDEVADRTNMLLLVGIAGTLFGIFEFAVRSLSAGGDRLTQISMGLSDSMAKAFPVGVVGLMLMLIFQLCLAHPISRLQKAASDAARKALENRGVVSRTLAESIAESIAVSMRPVSSLGDTVSKHLQPVVESLGKQLDQSLSLVRMQFGAIDQSTDRFSKATATLQQSANALTNSTARLGSLLEATPRVLTKTEQIQELQHGALTQISGAFESNLKIAVGVADALERVRSSIESLPDELIRRTVDAVGPAFARMADESVATWGALVRDLTIDLQREHAELIAGTRNEFVQIHSEIRGAAEEWQRLGTQSQSLISEPLQKGMEQIATAFEAVMAVARELAESVQSTRTQLVQLPDQFARQTASIVEPAFARVAEESAITWGKLVESVALEVQRDYTGYVASTREEVAKANAEIRGAAEAMRHLAQESQAFLTEPMKTAIETARREASGALHELDEFVRTRYPLVRDDMQTFTGQLQQLTATLQQVEERLRDLRFEVAQPPASTIDASAVVLVEIRDLLRRRSDPSPRPQKRRSWKWLLPNHWFDER